MAGTYSIDIEFLHYPHIPFHIGLGHHIALVGVEFVAVHTLDEYGLAIYKQLSALDFDGPESEIQGSVLEHSTLLVHSCKFETVEGRGLGCPKCHRCQVSLVESHEIALCREHRIAIGRIEFQRLVLLCLHCRSLTGKDFKALRGYDLPLHCGNSGSGLCPKAEMSVSTGVHPHVLYSLQRSCGNIDIAGDPGKTPEVLTLYVGSIAPAGNLKSNAVLAGNHIRGDVKAGLEFGVLAVAHLLSVHPDSHIGGCGTYMEYNLPALPVRSNIESLAVLSQIIVFIGNNRRCVWEMSVPRILHIDIHRVAPSVQVPHSRHRNFVPGRVVIGGEEEIGCTGASVLIEFEVP